MTASYVSAPVSAKTLGLRAWRATAIREARVVAAVAALALLAWAGLATALLLPHSAAAPSTQFLTPVVTDPHLMGKASTPPGEIGRERSAKDARAGKR
jgi:hypothetical protein